MQRAWIISEVLDVPFGVSNPTNNGTPMGDHQIQKLLCSKNLFSTADAEKFADFNSTIIFEI